MSNFVTVDDSDTTRIAYTGNWSLRGHSGDYQGTLHRTQSAAAKATFTFNGTSVQVFGTFPPSSPATSTYTLDGRAPVTLTSPNVSSPAFQQQFYASPPLSADTPHTLVIHPVVDGPNFYLDYIQYTPGTPAAGSNSSGAVGTSSAAASSSATGRASGSKTESGQAGAIAGGVIGGLAALGLIAGLLLLFRRRGRVALSNIGDPMAQPSGNRVRDIQPFVPPTSMRALPSRKSIQPTLSSNYASSSAVSPAPTSNAERLTVEAGSSLSRTKAPSPQSPAQASVSPSQASSSFLPIPGSPPGLSIGPLMHRDGGVSLEGSAPGQREELPPAYGDRG